MNLSVRSPETEVGEPACFWSPEQDAWRVLIGDPPPRPGASSHALAAEQISARLAEAAATRDRLGQHPAAELALLGKNDLISAGLSRDLGGAGLSRAAMIDIIRVVASADPAIAQILQPHITAVDTFNQCEDDWQLRFFGSELAAGKRFGSAVVEVGSKTSGEFSTMLRRRGDDWVLEGEKYYSTGSFGADWITALALIEDDIRAGRPKPVRVMVPVATKGVSILDDWSAFGQRTTISGTARFQAVNIPENHILASYDVGSDKHKLRAAFASLIHAAIDVGIAQGAFRDAIGFLQTKARPWKQAGVSRPGQEPALIQHYGRLATDIASAAALVARAASLLDEASQPATICDFAVAQAKASAAETANHVTSEVFEGTGATGTREAYALDRHWRNARTHTLHDPPRWRHHAVGDFIFNG